MGPLEGFVMNRVLGDYFENLLYKIFVTIDGSSSAKEVGTVKKDFSTFLDYRYSGKMIFIHLV